MLDRISIRVGFALLLTVSAVHEMQAAQLKIATLAPDGSAWMEAIREGAAEISDRTEGRVRLRVYPGGTMGNEVAVLRKMRIGQLHGGVFTAGTMATVHRDAQIYNLPVLFRSYDEVDHVRAQVDDVLMKNLEAKGYVAFGVMEGGFSYLMSSKETRNVDDLKGHKAWMPEGDEIGEAILDAAGLAPIPLAISDVLTGLQTGLVNTVAAPPVGAVALQWFTKVKYLLELPIIYTYGFVVVDAKALGRLDDADQEIVREVLTRVTAQLDGETRGNNEEARQALVKQGIKVVTPAPEVEQRWYEIAAEARQKLVEKGAVGAELVARIEGTLQEYRDSTGGG